MWTLSGFVDEISEDFETQFSVAAGLGLAYVEIRSAWGVNILDLDDSQLATVQETLDRHGLKASSIGSPIGKIFVDEDFEPHLERARHAADVAKTLGAPYIRLFSFFIRPDDDPKDHREEVLRRMRALADVGEGAGVVLVHENEKDIYGDVPDRCLDIIETVGSPNLRVAWDPANFVQVGVRPFSEGYASLRPHLEYMQIKDAHAADGTVTASSSIPSGRSARTASTGSSRSSRTSATSTRSAGSPVPSCSPARTPPSPGCCRTKESSTHEYRCTRPPRPADVRHRRRRSHRQAARQGDDRAG